MNPATHIAPEDLGLFALQLLTPEETGRVVEHLTHCSECRDEVARVQGDLCAYAMTAEMHTPPAAARERLLRRVAKEKKIVAIDRTAPASAQAQIAAEPTLSARSVRGFDVDADVIPIRRSAVGWLGYVGWATAAGLAVFSGLEFRDRSNLQRVVGSENATIAQLSTTAGRSKQVMEALTSTDAMQVAMHLPVSDANEPPVPQGHASYVPSTGTLVFVASHMPKLDNYKTYELWVLPKDGRDPIPAGLFKPDAQGNGSVTLPDLPRDVAASGFGVTVEDEGGSKNGPTKPIVLVGVGE